MILRHIRILHKLIDKQYSFKSSNSDDAEHEINH